MITKQIIIFLLIGFVVGLVTGMIFQQIIMIKGIEKVGESWEGIISEMNIEVKINETKLVEETWKIFPELNYSYIDEVLDIKSLWTCSLNWTCLDGYNWIDKDFLNEQGWEGADYDYPPQETALSHWAWSLPMEFEIDNTGTFRKCTAEVIDCYELNQTN